jgi:peptidoglycan/LPS O-acetylase OafA/YrhL
VRAASGLAPRRIRFIPGNHSRLVTLLRTMPSTRTVAPRAVGHRPGLQERFYFPELDAIRFFLFWGVWGYHALPREESVYVEHHVPTVLASLVTSLIKAGMASLDVFFILSAFLITELLLREKELRGVPDLKAFYIRRLLRIWPLYFFMIALAAFVSIFDRSQPLSWAYALCFLLFAGNWIMVFRGFPQAEIIGPLWSVSFEEQFYLLWPLVVRRASKKNLIQIAMGLLVLASLARLILLLKHTGGQPIWFNSFARLDSIACGILLASILHGYTKLHIGLVARLALLLAGISAWLVVGLYCGLLDPVPTLPGGMIGFPLMSLGGVAIFLCVLGAAQDGFPFLKYPWLVYLGKISYGLYAYHFLGFQLSHHLLTRYHYAHSWTLSWLLALAITFSLAVVSFRWLESPFLRLKRAKFTYIPSGADSGADAEALPAVGLRASSAQP